MRINAKTAFGKKVFIVQFLYSRIDNCWAITIDGNGKIEEYHIKDLIVIDGQYLR